MFVLTQHAREPLVMDGGTTFTFVTDGIESALEQAREAAGGRDVQINGGGSAGPPVPGGGAARRACRFTPPRSCSGSGTPLLGGVTGKLETTRVMESPTGATHVRYRVLK